MNEPRGLKKRMPRLYALGDWGATCIGRGSLWSRCERDRSIGWDRGIAAYANIQHRHVFDAKGYQCLLMEAGGITLAILGGGNNSLCDDLTHCAGRSRI